MTTATMEKKNKEIPPVGSRTVTRAEAVRDHLSELTAGGEERPWIKRVTREMMQV